jgi:hypothetical protein
MSATAAASPERTEIMPTPNWIAKAVILEPAVRRVTPIVEWRGTKTQLIVRTVRSGKEYRFRLDTLTAVNGPRRSGTRLAAPDDPAVLDALRTRAADGARGRVSIAVNASRLQDSGRDIETVTRKLIELRDEITKALADLSEVP